MLNYIKSFFVRDTDKIVRPLTKIVDRLDNHAFKQQVKAGRATAKAQTLQAKANARVAEADRAAAARAKITSLIG